MAIDAGTAFVDVLPRVSSFGSALNSKLGPQLSAVEKKTSAFGNVASLAFAAAGVAAVAFVASSIKSFQEHEAALNRLQTVISQSPKLVGQSTKAFEDQATALQDLTGFQDEEILMADASLARFQLTGDELKRVTPLVLDYARATGTDVVAASTNVGRALLGNTRALRSLGISYKATGNQGRDLEAILKALEQRVGGTAEAFGQTSLGKIEIFKAKLDDVQESIGAALLPVLDALVTALGALLPVVSVLAQNIVPLLAVFLGFKALQFLPLLLTGIAQGLAVIGAEGLAGRIIGLGLAVNGLTLSIGTMVPVMLAATAAWIAFQGITGKTPGVIDTTAGAVANFVAQSQGLVPTIAASKDALQSMGAEFEDNTGILKDNTDAMIANRQQREQLAGGLLGVAGAIGSAHDATKALHEAEAKLAKDRASGHASAKTLREDHDAITRAALSAEQAQLSLDQSITSYAADLRGPLKKAQDQYNADLIASQGEGKAAGEAQSRLAADLKAVTDAQHGLAPAQQHAIDQLRDLATKAGLSKGEIRDLIAKVLDLTNKVDGVPKTHTTTFYLKTVGSVPQGAGQITRVTAKGGVFSRFAAGRAFLSPFGDPFIAGEATYPTPLGRGGEQVSNSGVLPLSDDMIERLGKSIAEAGGGGGWHGHTGPIVVKVMIDRREIGRAVVAEEQWRR